MATNDLMSELQKDSIKLDDDSERKVSLIFTTRHYASAVHAVALCLSVCYKLGILPKWLNIGSCKQGNTIA